MWQPRPFPFPEALSGVWTTNFNHVRHTRVGRMPRLHAMSKARFPKIAVKSPVSGKSCPVLTLIGMFHRMQDGCDVEFDFFQMSFDFIMELIQP